MNQLKLAVLLVAALLSLQSWAAPAGKSPRDYVENFAAGERVLWLGEVVDVDASEQNHEVVFEWLCRYLEVAEPIDIDAYVKRDSLGKRGAPIKVRNTAGQYFVSVLRAPGVSLQAAKQEAEAMKKAQYFVLREGATDFVGTFKGKPVVYVSGGRGAMAHNVKFVYVR